MSETYLSKVPYEEGVVLKTKYDLQHMRRSGSCVSRVLSRVASEVKPGVSTSYLEEVCNVLLRDEYGGCRIEYPEDFSHYISISINETAVHGVPGSRILRGGDLVTLDVALKLDGWFGDSAVTVPVGSVAPETMRLLTAARRACEAGMGAVAPGGRLGDIGAAIGAILEGSGFWVIENLAGHGVGMELHEAPTVLHSGEYGVGAPVVPGMVFTVEPVITSGEPIVVPEKGGVGLVTRDGEPTALFEHCLAVTSEGVVRLT